MREQKYAKIAALSEVTPLDGYENDVLRNPDIGQGVKVRLINVHRRCQRVLEINRCRVAQGDLASII